MTAAREATSSYDPEVRRDTPLALSLKEEIRRTGPLRLDEFVRRCLQDENNGYYRRKAAIGAGGDFITSPEISQIFGELIGLWCAVTWQQMGRPSPFNLVELGPGRGTLMRDALRAVTRVDGFLDAARIRLVDTNDALRAEQASALRGAARHLSWHRSLDDHVPQHPTILIANEYLDTCERIQYVRHGGDWRLRVIDDGGGDRLAFGVGALPGPVASLERFAPCPEGAIIEDGEYFSDANLHHLQGQECHPLAAVFIDYGHTTAAPGDTLQAVRNHAFEHPLTSPGEADLTFQVDFGGFAAEGQKAGLTIDGPITQAELLGRLGIIERASRLMSANPGRAAEIEASVVRLMAPNGMGTRFKAIGLRSSSMPVLPGFEK